MGDHCPPQSRTASCSSRSAIRTQERDEQDAAPQRYRRRESPRCRRGRDTIRLFLEQFLEQRGIFDKGPTLQDFSFSLVMILRICQRRTVTEVEVEAFAATSSKRTCIKNWNRR